MHYSLKPFFIHAVLVAFFLCPFPASAVSFGYLYIEASEGNSSGGHSAIQFGDEIYHYQHHDSGLIRLLKQDKAEFHFLYRFLQNRPIHLSRVEVSRDTFDILRDYFKLQFLAQEQQFKQLNTLHKDRLLLRRLLYKQSSDDTYYDAVFFEDLRLKGAGLFYSDQEFYSQNRDWRFRQLNGLQSQSSKSVERVRMKIEQTYGQNHLSKRLAQITRQIKTLAPGPWSKAKPILSKENFPPAIDSIADNYADHLTGLVAIKVLTEAQPLQTDSLILTREPVTAGEQKALENLRDQMTLSVLRSVSSHRPDWGHAVLINIARLVAVDLSLHLGQWVFVDDFASDSEWLSADQFEQAKSQMQIQIMDAHAGFLQTRTALLNTDGLTEANYSKLEMSANRYFELLKGRQNKAVRFVGEKALPTKSISLPDRVVPELTTLELTTALSKLENFETKLFQEMAERYRYDLITRNCVTELFGSIDQALLQHKVTESDASKHVDRLLQESTEGLGGNISAPYNFIPFLSFQWIQEQYRVTASSVLNSYRGQQLEKLFSRHGKVISAIRESNTLTSTLYDYNPDDAFFIFFSDDRPVFRPIFGLFNTAAGIGQSVYGLVSLPFDAGKNLKSGATGVLMSLPELLFFNMRKGSFKYLSYSQFVNDEQSE